MLELMHIFWLLIIFNIIASIYQRRKLTRVSSVLNHEIPSLLQAEVDKQISDGYRIVSSENEHVRLVKTTWSPFAWMFVFVLPNVALNTCFLCNVFGIELTLSNNKVNISTF